MNAGDQCQSGIRGPAPSGPQLGGGTASLQSWCPTSSSVVSWEEQVGLQKLQEQVQRQGDRKEHGVSGDGSGKCWCPDAHADASRFSPVWGTTRNEDGSSLWRALSTYRGLWMAVGQWRKLLIEVGVSWTRYAMKVKVAQSCLTLCDPTDCIVYGILQARILESVAFPFSKESSQPRDGTQVSLTAGGFFTSWATREAQTCCLFRHAFIW